MKLFVIHSSNDRPTIDKKLLRLKRKVKSIKVLILDSKKFAPFFNRHYIPLMLY